MPEHISGLDLVIYADVAEFFSHICSRRPEKEILRQIGTLPLPKQNISNIFATAYSIHAKGMRDYVVIEGPKAMDHARHDWYSLFGIHQPSLLSVPPYEVFHIHKDQDEQQHLLTNLAALYADHKFTLQPDEDTPQSRPDFLGKELGFITHLLRIIANYRLTEKAVVANSVLQGFYLAHFSRWVPQYCVRAYEVAQTPLFKHYLLLLKGYCDNLTTMLNDFKNSN